MSALEASRLAALKEAAWYRAKLAAYEQGNASDGERLDQERSSALESQLAETQREKSSLQRQVAQMQEQLKLETQLRHSTDERLSETSKRALAAEAAQMSVYEQIAELQKRAFEAESGLREHKERAVSLAALLDQERASHEQTRSLKDEVTSSATSHADTLMQLKTALVATGARADEHQRLYTQHRDLAQSHQKMCATLQSQLGQREQEMAAVKQRVVELGTLLAAAEAEAAAHRHASTNALTEAMSTRDFVGQRSFGGMAPDSEGKIRSLEDEVASLHEMHASSRQAVDEAVAELIQVRERNMAFEKQHTGLQSELDVSRAQLSIALQEMARLKDQAATKAVELRDAIRASERANIKLQLLQEHMSEQGLPPLPDADEGQGSTMAAQVVALQNEADTGARAVQELQSKAADAQVEIDALKRELAGATDRATVDEAMRRAEVSERELAETTASYKDRMAQLENDYYAAVSFVKGSEKMLRKMRDSLARTKQDNARLQEEVERLKASTAGPTSADQSEDLSVLQSRLADVSSANQEVGAENQELERRMASLISEQKDAYQRSRAQLDAVTESSRKVQTLEQQIGSLEDTLSVTREELQNTLALNQHLSRELARVSVAPS